MSDKVNEKKYQNRCFLLHDYDKWITEGSDKQRRTCKKCARQQYKFVKGRMFK